MFFRLTAFCARIFFKATFQEWEHFLYIDPDVISKAVNWLLDYQSPEGAFYETTLEPLDRKMDPSVLNISFTIDFYGTF